MQSLLDDSRDDDDTSAARTTYLSAARAVREGATATTAVVACESCGADSVGSCTGRAATTAQVAGPTGTASCETCISPAKASACAHRVEITARARTPRPAGCPERSGAQGCNGTAQATRGTD